METKNAIRKIWGAISNNRAIMDNTTGILEEVLSQLKFLSQDIRDVMDTQNEILARLDNESE